MADKNMNQRITVRVDETVATVLEELQGLGLNTSDLVREMLDDALPGLQGMVRVIRAERAGLKLDARKELKRMLAELTKKAVETGMES